MCAHPDSFATLRDVADAVTAFNPHRRAPVNPDGLRRNVRLGADGRWHWHWDPAFLQDNGDEPRRLIPEERLHKAAARVAVPTMLVRGANSDVLSKEGVREFLELVPDASYVDVSGTGHMVAGDDNDAFTTNVLRFVDPLRS